MDHIREHRSLLASAEKRLLVAIARRLPLWLTSDHLTLLGLGSLGAAGLAFSRDRLTLPGARPASHWPWPPTGSATASTAPWRGCALNSVPATATTSIM